MEGDPGCGSRASPVSPHGMSPPRAHRSICHHLLKELMSFLLREGGLCVGVDRDLHDVLQPCSQLCIRQKVGPTTDGPFQPKLLHD